MDDRRNFIKKALLLAGTTGLVNTIPPAIQRALAIEPIAGSTFMDAEHIVILMQENRSFDHAFGTLKGVRGFNDPRFIRLPNGNPVWFQPDKQGNAYAPFRLDLKHSKATWMGAVPHSRQSQVDAFNDGKYDNWIEAKRKSKPYADIPLTMGYHNRQDIPFNYALADAFTICDQNFCSGMTSTWPNRFFFWTGTVREAPNAESKAWMRNDLPLGHGKWKTFPERLEEAGVPWKVYQNDITCGGGFVGEERSWLANFGCNPLELFERYNVKFSSRYVKTLKTQTETLPKEIADLENTLKGLRQQDAAYAKTQKAIQKKREVLQQAYDEIEKWTEEHFNSLNDTEKNLFNRAFSTNAKDPDYHHLDVLRYTDDQGKQQELTVPKGDILHQFRTDVENGTLPTVSWMVPAEKYSDHPTAPWYGSWYVSEIMDILTKNPEVWQKTIFIMTYDENDGYFDHVPPFIPPNPYVANSGKCSDGIDTKVEYTLLAQELAEGKSKEEARGAAIGLGFRVPMIIASPWTRGGKVCSQVFDHTSTLQFLEKFLNRKLNHTIEEKNISDWRRTVCGDLTAVFQTADEQSRKDNLPFIQRNTYLEDIHQAKFKKSPTDFRKLPKEEIDQAKNNPWLVADMPKQEEGIKESCPLPYELYADMEARDGAIFLTLAAGNSIFQDKSAGAPFTVYTPAGIRSYAVAPGDHLEDTFALKNGLYDLHVHGPNGFYRAITGKSSKLKLALEASYELKEGKATGNLVMTANNPMADACTLLVLDKAYNQPAIEKQLQPGEKLRFSIPLQNSHGWYDLSITMKDDPAIKWLYAGRVETGKFTYTDPQMGKLST
jgi:phospholipase C